MDTVLVIGNPRLTEEACRLYRAEGHPGLE